MYSITNALSERCNRNAPLTENIPCEVIKVASAILVTLGLGAAAFSAIFFTAHLLIPSLATSISLVVLLSGTDVCILICCKCRNTNREINLLGDQPPHNPENPAEQLYDEDLAFSFEGPAQKIEYEQALFEYPDEEIGIQPQIQENNFQPNLATNQEVPNLEGNIDVLEKDIFAAKVFAINDMVLEIFKFLNIKDLYKIQLVCKQWKECSDKVLQLKFVQILEKTKHLKEIILSEDELHLYTVFLMKSEKKNALGKIDDISKTLDYKIRQLTWNDYIRNNKKALITIENLQDTKVCQHIDAPILGKVLGYYEDRHPLNQGGNLKYFLINGYLMLWVSIPISLHLWNLKDGSPIALPKTVLDDFNATGSNDLGPPYIYKNLLVRNMYGGKYIKIHDLTTGESTIIGNSSEISKSTTKFIASCEENIAVDRGGNYGLSIFNLETKKMTTFRWPIVFKDNLRVAALNTKYMVILSRDSSSMEGFTIRKDLLIIYKKSKKANKYSEKMFRIYIELDDLVIHNNFLFLQSRSSIFILDLSLPEKEIWEKRKSFSKHNQQKS